MSARARGDRSGERRLPLGVGVGANVASLASGLPSENVSGAEPRLRRVMALRPDWQTGALTNKAPAENAALAGRSVGVALGCAFAVCADSAPRSPCGVSPA